MSNLILLPKKNKLKFQSTPFLSPKHKSFYFSLSKDVEEILTFLKSPINKAGFLLQLGYFKATAKFYSPHQFRPSDIKYVSKILGCRITISDYKEKTARNHQQKILEVLQWQPFNHTAHLNTFVEDHVRHFASPKEIFLEIIEYCWKNKIEIPSYSTISTIITKSYNVFEKGLIQELSKLESLETFRDLEKLILNKPHERAPITILKEMSHSTNYVTLKHSIEEFFLFKNYFLSFESLYESLNLSDQTIQYFSSWVQKASAFQIQQLGTRKAGLYLLGFIKHQFYYRHDLLMDIFLTVTQSLKSSVNSQDSLNDKATKPDRLTAIKTLSKFHKSSTKLIDELTALLTDPIIDPTEKIFKSCVMLSEYHNAKDKTLNAERLTKTIESLESNMTYYTALEKASKRNKRKADMILKVLIFNPKTSDSSLLKSLRHYQTQNGKLSKKTPTAFLSAEEKNQVMEGSLPKASLFRPLLAIHTFEKVKAGQMNLLYSYRYKSIQDYLINQKLWDANKDGFLKNAEMLSFKNHAKVMAKLKVKLHEKYCSVNERILANNNPHITFDDNGDFKIATPSIDYSQDQYIPSLLNHLNYITLPVTFLVGCA